MNTSVREREGGRDGERERDKSLASILYSIPFQLDPSPWQRRGPHCVE